MRGVRTLKKITREMPQWKQAYDAHVWDLESDIRGLKSEINRLRRIVLDWRPRDGGGEGASGQEERG